ncbi:uncharacterized protein LOC144106489 isoform X2 [Amblyomma americanum]
MPLHLDQSPHVGMCHVVVVVVVCVTKWHIPTRLIGRNQGKKKKIRFLVLQLGLTAAGWMSGAPSPPGLKPARLLALLLLLCARASLAEEGDDLREPVHHTASTTCPEKIPLWQCLRLSWSAPPCRTNFDCAMPFPCCVTWCRNFCANDFRA